MVIGPGWGQDSVGTDGGVSVLPDGSTVMGEYGATSIIKGSPSGIHTQWKSSDSTSSDHELWVTTTARNGGAAGVISTYNTAAASTLQYGAGNTARAIDAATAHTFYAHTSVGGHTAGILIAYMSANGVNVGSNPAAPGAGRAFQVTTSAQAESTYWADATGTQTVPFDGNHYAAGASGADYVFAHDGSNTFWQNYTGGLFLRNVNGSGSLYMDCGVGGSFFVRENSTVITRVSALTGWRMLSDSYGYKVGAGDDAHFYHDGADSFLDNATGRLFLKGGSSIYLDAEGATGHAWVRAVGAGDVYIQSTSGEIEFSAGGAQSVTVNTNGLVCALDGSSGAPNIACGASGASDFLLYSSGTETWIRQQQGNLYLFSNSGDLYHRTGTAGKKIYFQAEGTTTVAQFDVSGLELPLDGTGADPNLTAGSGGEFSLYQTGSFTNIQSDTPIQVKANGTTQVGQWGGTGAALLVDQWNGAGGKPVLYLDQGDEDQPMIRFQGVAPAANATATFSSHPTAGAIQEWMQVNRNGAKRWIPLYADPSA